VWKKDSSTIDLNWNVSIDNLKFHLSPSEMGQVGVFPEQRENWAWIQRKLRSSRGPDDKMKSVLNGFAYTGGSTMASLRYCNLLNFFDMRNFNCWLVCQE